MADTKKMEQLGIYKEELVKALEESGQWESALNLQNWGIMDEAADELLNKAEAWLQDYEEVLAKSFAEEEVLEKAKKNPDEKEDAELGEKVEEDVEEHMKANAKAERKEGHKISFKKGADEDRSNAGSDGNECDEDIVKDEKKPKLGTGKRFSKLKSKLSHKGASDPGALAGWIGRKKYGAKKMAKLSHHKK